MALATDTLLSDVLLDECAARTRRYDQENSFFHEDFDELRRAGYLLMAVPEELGGLGYKLNRVCQEQRRLARRSPATALATNMHLYWTGVAADLYRMGDSSCQWMLEEAAAGDQVSSRRFGGHGA